MRKLTMLVALVAIFSLALAGPALAALVVNLGPGNNTYDERRCPPDGDEQVSGLAGDDVLRLQLCGDTANEPDPAGTTPDSDADIANGNRGKDRVRVDDGDIQDTASGGSGSNDRCVGDLDLGDGVMDVDEPPTGPNPEGSGPEQDVGDNLDPSCDTIIWVPGEYYHQT
jgi:hypothetical protein